MNKNYISNQGVVFCKVTVLISFGLLCAVGLGAYFMCADSPAIRHIADVHIDSLANGLMTYASISVGFILTEFALLISFSENPFFLNWRRTGRFRVWKILNMIALLTSIGVLVSSLILLAWERALPVVVAILCINAMSMLMVFIPLILVAEAAYSNKTQA